MGWRARIGIRAALAAVLVAGLGSPHAVQAGDPIDCKLQEKGKTKVKAVDSPQECKRLGGELQRRYYCEVQKPGKTTIKPTPSPQDCSRVGGKVVRKPKVPRGSRSQRPLN